MGDEIEREAKKMPLLGNTMDHEVLGREYKRGLQEGREEGREEGRGVGREEGLHDGVTQGEVNIFRRLAAKRFGLIPEWATQELSAHSPAEIEALSDAILACSSLNELLARLKPRS